jgi:hypothetical protein
MNTITVAVPKDIAQKYGKQVVNYSDLFDLVAEHLWIDAKLQPTMKMKDFFDLVKNSDHG